MTHETDAICAPFAGEPMQSLGSGLTLPLEAKETALETILEACSDGIFSPNKSNSILETKEGGVVLSIATDCDDPNP